MMLGTPLALQSYWGLVVVVPALLTLAVRIHDEENMLTKELPGYAGYTRYRLLPGVW